MELVSGAYCQIESGVEFGAYVFRFFLLGAFCFRCLLLASTLPGGFLAIEFSNASGPGRGILKADMVEGHQVWELLLRRARSSATGKA